MRKPAFCIYEKKDADQLRSNHEADQRLCFRYTDSTKQAFCIYENKDADQLRGNREADQRLCFHYTEGTVPLLPKSEISSL